jgi:hypothetical protein
LKAGQDTAQVFREPVQVDRGTRDAVRDAHGHQALRHLGSGGVQKKKEKRNKDAEEMSSTT